MTELLVLAFSKDRAFQVDALLRSYRLHCGTDTPPVTVLFRCTTAEHREQYRQVARENPWHRWVEETDFREQLLALLEAHQKILFLTDDSLFVGSVKLSESVQLLEDPSILGVSLRLGLNCKVCYPAGDKPQALPPAYRGKAGWLINQWPHGEFDWGYPLEVSSSVYRAEQVVGILGDREFGNPNQLEVALANAAPSFRDTAPLLACPEQSRCFAIPWNRTTTAVVNRASQDAGLSVDALSNRYARGERLDVEGYSGLVPRSVHQEIDLRLRFPNGKKRTKAPLVVVSTSDNAEEWCERCLSSVAYQTVACRHIYVSDDKATLDAARQLVAKRGWTHVEVRDGCGQHVQNLIDAIGSLSPETVVVWLDGDDWLARPDALEIVALAYEDPNVWLTFGQFRWWPSGELGFAAEYPAHVVAANSYRLWHWLATILRTFRAGLFHQLDYADLLLSNGSCVDQLLMLPMLELAGARHRFIPHVLAEYNAAHFPRISAKNEETELRRLRARQPLARLEEAPWPSSPVSATPVAPVRLVLNMIVKDEALIIRRCIESCKPLISSWCIVDTGSTDGTQQIIREALWDVPGELHERPWVDFGTNRTEAYELARPLGDYVLWMDADHEVVGVLSTDIAAEELDAYYADIHMGSSVYRIVRVASTKRAWKFVGPTHEWLECDGPFVSGDLSGVVIHEYPDSARRKSGNKTLEDIAWLERELDRNPQDTRTVFYLAQSYYDADEWQKAFENYAKRVQMAGPAEEVFWSLMRMGEIQQDQGGDWAKAQELYLSAYQVRPSRAEPLCILANWYNEHKMGAVARLYAERAMAMVPSPDDILFIQPGCYGGELAKAEYERAMA